MSAIREKPFWVRVALLGFALYLSLILTYVVVSAVTSDTGSIVFSLIAGIPAVIAVALILRFRSWALVVGALLSVFGILFFISNIVVGLSTPDSFFDFITGTVGGGGLVLALVGSAVAFMQRRSGRASLSGPPLAVTAVRGLLALMLITGVISAVLTLVNKDTVSAADKKDAVLITASKSEWSTDRIESSSTGTLRLVVKNSDPYLHTFTVKDLNMDFKLKPGSEQLIVLERPLAGSHEFICSIHTEMKGTVEVR